MVGSDLKLIRQEVQRRNISRVCHLTQSRKLPHILGSLNGIHSVEWLQQYAPDLLDVNDKQRLDRLLDHISCSIEYPNSWYLRNAASREILFKDWVVLLLKPEVLWRKNNRFCVRNCGARGGKLAKEGHQSFTELFQTQIKGSRGKIFERTPQMPDCCPTDGQAEVMVHRHIERNMIFGVVTPDEKRAGDEIYRLEMVGISPAVVKNLKWIVSPDMFSDSWNKQIKVGKRPDEIKVVL